jgi:hypothetical protein
MRKRYEAIGQKQAVHLLAKLVGDRGKQINSFQAEESMGELSPKSFSASPMLLCLFLLLLRESCFNCQDALSDCRGLEQESMNLAKS